MRLIQHLPWLAAFSLTASACASVESESTKVINQSTFADAGSKAAPSKQNGWALAWSDEFDSDAIDRTKWGFGIDCWGGGNEERQCYTSNPQNAAIEDGKLVITARKESTTGPALPPAMRGRAADPDALQTKPFSSAKMTTKGKAAWRYGWIEVRAKLPQGQGTWPAIWMLPEDNVYGPWAASGEIDILEAVNLGVDCSTCPGGTENTILGTLHFGGIWPNNNLHSTEVAHFGEPDDFHTYSLVWSEGKFTWMVDGRVFAVTEADAWSTTATDAPNAPFDERFHLILNLAIGGGLPEGRGLGGVSEEGFPKRFEIDWVRVWQCSKDPANGQTCPIGGGI